MCLGTYEFAIFDYNKLFYPYPFSAGFRVLFLSKSINMAFSIAVSLGSSKFKLESMDFISFSDMGFRHVSCVLKL